MLKVSESVMIGRPPSEVFAFVSDLSSLSKWQTEVVKSSVLTPGPTKVGSRFTEDVKLGPMRAVAQCEVTEFAPGQIMGFTASSSAVEYQGRLAVEPHQGGAKLTLAGSMRPKGFWRLVQPLMGGELKTGVRKELQTVKRLLEESRTPIS